MSKAAYGNRFFARLAGKINVLVILVLMVFSTTAQAQFKLYDTIPYNPRKLTRMALLSTGIYTVGLIGLNEVWYKDTPRESFHFFNDNHQWMQVDKVGHAYSAFYLSAGSAKAINKGGVKANQSALLGAAVGFTALMGIELLDGYSAAYGASAGDLVANAAGSTFYWGQQMLWKELRIQPKFSFHTTQYPELRQDLAGDDALGDTFVSQVLKDYNGQTYWLSVDVDKFTPFPKWLNLAVGYGAEGMVYATNQANAEAGYTPFRQYYIGIDFDLNGIRTRSKVVRFLLTAVSLIRLPAPAFSLSSEGVRFHPLYF